MHASLKANPLLRGLTAKSGYILVPYEHHTPTVAEHINAWVTSHEPEYRAYAQLLQTEESWRIMGKMDPKEGGAILSIPIPESLLNVIDPDYLGVALQIQGSEPYTPITAMRSVRTIGEKFYGIPTKVSGATTTYHIISGIGIGNNISSEYAKPYDANFVSPWEMITAKIVAMDNNDYLQRCSGYYLRFMRRRDGSRNKEFYIADGPYNRYSIPAHCLQLPKDADEALIFDRKALAPYQLHLGPKCKATVIGNQANFPLQSMNASWEGMHMWQYSMTPTNYWEMDPNDYKRVTFLPQAKVAAILEKGLDPWDNPSRMSTTWAKLLRQQVNTTYYQNDSHYENFSTAMVAAMAQLFGPEEDRPHLLVVTGKDIAKYYNMEHYMVLQGGLGGSCMRHVSAKFFDMYANNPEQIGMLILKDRHVDKIYGRAIVWTDNDGKKWIDRRYTINHVEEQKMMLWAEANGYTDLWGGHHSPKAGVKVTLKKPYHERYPYMDSMCNLDVDTGTLSSLPIPGKKTSMVKDTGGHRSTLSHEVACAATSVYAPKTAMVETASHDYAFREHVIELRTGKLELKKRTVVDGLDGGVISKAEAVPVLVNNGSTAKLVDTSRHNPSIAKLHGDATTFVLKEDVVMSQLDGGFIAKATAKLMPDGKYVSPANEARYREMLAKKKVNKANVAVAAATATPARRTAKVAA